MIENNPFLISARTLVSFPSPPVINVNPFSKRKDVGIIDWINFWKLLSDEAFLKTIDRRVITTFNASPHTPLTIEFDKVKKPAHFLVWVKNYDESTKIPGIASLKEEDIFSLSSQTAEAVFLLLKHLNYLKSSPIIYSLQGYSNRDIFSPGPQSNPFFHIHISSFPLNPDFSFDQSPSLKEKMKYYGVFNSVIFDLFKQMVEKFLINKGVIIQSNNEDFQLNLKFSDSERDSIADYFYLLKEIGVFFDNFYQGLIDYYKKAILGNFRLPGSIEELKISLKQRLTEDNIDFPDDFYQKILGLISFVRPSKNFINYLIREETDEMRKKRLESFLERNERIRELLASYESRRRLKTFFNLTEDEAEIFFAFLNDIFSSDRPVLGFSEHFPWAFLFDDYTLAEKGDFKYLKVDSGVKIRPMFLNAGGNIAERIIKGIIRR